jgi:heptosyltransferase-2
MGYILVCGQLGDRILRDFLIGMNNYLIIQTAFLGDVVLALSMGEYIKMKDNDAHIVFVTTRASESIVSHCPYIDEVIVYDKYNEDRGLTGLWKFASQLNLKKYSAVFTPHRSFRSTLLTGMLSSGEKYGFDKSAMSFLFKNRIKYEPADHEIKRNLSLARAHWKDWAADIILPVIEVEHEKKDTIAIAPGSVWATKRWPVHKWIELVSNPELADKEIIIIGSRDDKDIANEIEIKSGNNNITNFAGKLSVIESINKIAECKLIISNDSAPQHFAVAVGTPVITIFGATVPRFGFYPAGPDDKIVERDKALDCRPCGIHGLRKCKIQTFDCMSSIPIGRVIIEINTILK